MKSITRTMLASLAVSVLMAQGTASAESYLLKKNQISKQGKNLCILVKNKWTPGKKVGAKYAKNLKASSANKALCKTLLKPSKSSSLTQLPEVGELVSGSSSAAGFANSAVSGTAPTFLEIATLGADNVFWRSGVISAIGSGTPSSEQCSELFNSSSDGQSGGFAACYMNQNVGYSLSEIQRSGTTLCYMKNFPTEAVQAAGAIAVTSGSLPGGDITRLFTTPNGSRARVVKILAGTGDEVSSIYIRVASNAQNEAAGNQYKFEFWSCDNGAEAEPQEYETTKITSGGEYISTSVHTYGENGRGTATVRGFLERQGTDLVFNPSRDRTAVFGGSESSQGGDRVYRASVTVSSGNVITSKVRDGNGAGPRKSYSVARFTGEGLSSLRFLEGATKEENSEYSFSAAVEYRDTYYAAAPSSEFSADISSVNFSTDSFYETELSIPSMGSVSCSATPDISLTLDMANAAMEAVRVGCEGDRLDGDSVQFCQSTAVSAAAARYASVCGG
jgi:hypothetical protein